MWCAECGNQLDDTQTVCEKCGTPVVQHPDWGQITTPQESLASEGLFGPGSNPQMVSYAESVGRWSRSHSQNASQQAGGYDQVASQKTDYGQTGGYGQNSEVFQQAPTSPQNYQQANAYQQAIAYQQAPSYSQGAAFQQTSAYQQTPPYQQTPVYQVGYVDDNATTASTGMSQGADPAKRSQAPIIVAIIVALAVVLGIVICALLIFAPSKSSSSSGDQQGGAAYTNTNNNTAGSGKNDGSSNVWFTNDWMRFATSISGLSYTIGNNGYSVNIGTSNARYAFIYVDGLYNATEDEGRRATFKLGTITVNGASRDVIMRLYYTSNGSSAAHWADNSANTLLIEGINYSPESFAREISLHSNGAWVSAGCTAESDMAGRFTSNGKVSGSSSSSSSSSSGSSNVSSNSSGTNSVSSAKRTTPFYGVWVGASKDPSDLSTAVAELGSEAHIVLTTDWSNLNSEPWYVLTYGFWDTESKAIEALAVVQAKNGYGSAYVKHSGNYQG